MQENRLSVRALYTKIQDFQLDDIGRKAWLWVKNVNRVLVKWRFVVHRCVDGFTCLLGFLSVAQTTQLLLCTHFYESGTRVVITIKSPM